MLLKMEIYVSYFIKIIDIIFFLISGMILIIDGVDSKE